MVLEMVLYGTEGYVVYACMYYSLFRVDQINSTITINKNRLTPYTDQK